MLRISSFLLIICCGFLMFSACGSSPSSNKNSGADSAAAQAAARDALNRLDGQVGQAEGAPGGSSSSRPATATPSSNNPSTNTSAAQQGTNVNTSRTKPAWVDAVDSVYNRNQYVAAVGNASDRTMSERNALANLTGIFGQSIRADQTITNTYFEAVKNGVTAGWTDTIAMNNTIATRTSMDTLVGAEVREVWSDSKNTWYAVAVMEKAKTTQVYTEMIKANQNMISNLITMSQAEKNTLEGFSRYQFAATVADINTTYGNLLQVIGAPLPAGMLKGDNYRIEAQNITKTIPIGIKVLKDKSKRIEGAFAKSLSELGFRSGGTNSRYMLDVNIDTSPVDFPNNSNKFTRMELGANLTDTSQKAVLFPYNFNLREGHATQSEAENRTYTVAERKINDEYANLLSDYLSQLLPVRR
jgi:hypothetical protein